MSNVELAKGKAVQPKKSKASLKKRVKLCFLLVANVIVLTVVYTLWVTERPPPYVWELFMTNRGMVTGIIYNMENPSAIVHGEIVHEGDTVNGYKVLKIHRREVELEKDGKTLTKRVK